MPLSTEERSELEMLRKTKRLRELETKYGKEEPSFIESALTKAARALDYPAGLARTAVAQVADPLVDVLPGEERELVTKEDWQKALQGQAPTGAEFLERARVPAGGQLSDILPSLYSPTGEGLPLKKGGLFDPTPRGAAGLALDIGTDPLTYATAGLAAAGKTAKLGKMGKAARAAVTPVSTGLTKAGTKIYKSGLKKVDKIAAKYGKVPPSDILLREGVAGSSTHIANEADRLMAELGKKRDGLLREASREGAIVDLDRAMRPAQARIDKMARSKDPLANEASAQGNAILNKYKKLEGSPAEKVKEVVETGVVDAAGKPITKTITRTVKKEVPPANPTPKELSDMKTSISQLINQKEFEVLANSKPGQAILKKLGMGFKKEVERSAGPLGKRIKDTNRDWGSLLTARKTFASEAAKGGPPLFTEVDALTAYFGGFPALGVKQTAKAAKTGFVRTKTGKALQRLGTGRVTAPALDIGLRRALIESQR